MGGRKISMKFETILSQLIVEERLSTGLATSLTWALDNYLGFLALRQLGNVGKRMRLRELSFKKFLLLLKLNVLMLYIPGLGLKRLRELRLAVMRYIDEHNLEYEFPHVDEVRVKKRGRSIMEKFGYYYR
jgi:hypothetical protein